MALPLKTRGIEDVKSLKKRVMRQRTLARISPKDADELVALLEAVEVKITNMEEKGAGKKGVDFDI